MPTAERGTVPAPVAGVGATEITETRPGSSKERWLRTSQHRKNSERGKVRERLFRRAGRLGGLRVGGREGAAPRELSGLQCCNQRQSVGGRRPPSSSRGDLTLASSAPPPRQAAGFPCPHMVKPGPSWHRVNEQKVVTYAKTGEWPQVSVGCRLSLILLFPVRPEEHVLRNH